MTNGDKKYLVDLFLSGEFFKNGVCSWKKMAEEVMLNRPSIFDEMKGNNPGEFLRRKFANQEFQAMIAGTDQKEETKCRTEHKEGEINLREQRRDSKGRVTSVVDLFTSDDNLFLDDEDVLKMLKYDPRRFRLVNSKIRKGTYQMNTKNGVQALHSYRIEGTVEPLTEGITQAVVDAMVDSALKANNRPLRKASKRTVVGDKIALVCIADLHFGKLASESTCGERYDHEIAAERFWKIIDEAVEYIKKEKTVEKIVFFWSQDFFHVDTRANKTTAGTPQDVSLTYTDMLCKGIDLLVEAIRKLEKLAPVETFYVRGNHDSDTSLAAAKALEVAFRYDANVTVDASSSPRKYVKYGVNLFGFAHGDMDGKQNEHGDTMKDEAKEYWADSTNKEFFMGHYHHQKTVVDEDHGGIICRYLMSPTSPDMWTKNKGFVGSQKGAELFIRGKKEGRICNYNITF